MEVRPYKNHLGFKNKILRVLWHFVYLLFFVRSRIFCSGSGGFSFCDVLVPRLVSIVKSGLLQCSGPHGMWKWEIM